MDLARDKSETLVQRDAVVQAAQNRAANIIEQARQDAEAIRNEADDYVPGSTGDLEAHLIKTLTVVRNGITKNFSRIGKPTASGPKPLPSRPLLR